MFLTYCQIEFCGVGGIMYQNQLLEIHCRKMLMK